MPDERQDSIRQGISAPEESAIGRAAERKRRRQAGKAPPMDSAMGGTSDVDSPADEAQYRALEQGAGKPAQSPPADDEDR